MVRHDGHGRGRAVARPQDAHSKDGPGDEVQASLEVLENGLTSLAERCERLEACGAALSPEQAKSAAASALRLSERANGLRRALARVGAKGAKLHERHTEVASLAISLAIPRR